MRESERETKTLDLILHHLLSLRTDPESEIPDGGYCLTLRSVERQGEPFPIDRLGRIQRRIYPVAKYGKRFAAFPLCPSTGSVR
jgi:hypothetical protein